MNQKIKTELALGIILILALLIGGIIWLGNKKKVNQNKPTVPVVTPACQNFPPPEFCPGGPGDVIVTGKDERGCSTYGCK